MFNIASYIKRETEKQMREKKSAKERKTKRGEERGCVSEGKRGRRRGQTDRWTDKRTNGQTDGQTDSQKVALFPPFIFFLVLWSRLLVDSVTECCRHL